MLSSVSIGDEFQPTCAASVTMATNDVFLAQSATAGKCFNGAPVCFSVCLSHCTCGDCSFQPKFQWFLLLFTFIFGHAL